MKGQRIALLGCGYWGRNWARNLSELGVLALVCDPEKEGLERAIETAPSVSVGVDFERAFQSREIDGVVIASPAETHYRLARQAIEAGKDVLVEKPMTLDSKDGIELTRLATDSGRILMVGHLLEYHPAILRLQELISAGDLGPVNYIYSNRLNFGKIRTEENALWSFAPHDIAVILRLFGDTPLDVTCSGGNYLTPELADVTVSCLRFESGKRAHIFVSWLNPFKEQKLVVVGQSRMACFEDTSNNKLALYDQRVDFLEGLPVLQRNGCQNLGLLEKEPLREECIHFLECMKTRQQPLTDGASGVRVLKVLEACQKSLENGGGPVSLNGR